MRSSGPEPENESSSFSPSFFLLLPPPPPLDRVSLKESLSGARFPEKGREKERRREKLHHHHHPRPTGFTRIEKSLSYPPETRPRSANGMNFRIFREGHPSGNSLLISRFPISAGAKRSQEESKRNERKRWRGATSSQRKKKRKEESYLVRESLFLSK